MAVLNKDYLKLKPLTQFPSNPQEGEVVYKDGKMYYYNGNEWKEIGFNTQQIIESLKKLSLLYISDSGNGRLELHDQSILWYTTQTDNFFCIRKSNIYIKFGSTDYNFNTLAGRYFVVNAGDAIWYFTGDSFTFKFYVSISNPEGGTWYIIEYRIDFNVKPSVLSDINLNFVEYEVNSHGIFVNGEQVADNGTNILKIDKNGNVYINNVFKKTISDNSTISIFIRAQNYYGGSASANGWIKIINIG